MRPTSLFENSARRDIVEIARLSYEQGYICGVEGNFSIRLDKNTILATPRNTCKARISVEDLVLTDTSGRVLDYPENSNGKLPSTELEMHLTVYRSRPDIGAVVHTHPTFAVAFSVAGKSLTEPILPEVVSTLGEIPIAPYGTPSTGELSNNLASLIDNHDAIVLDHHGAITVGDDIWKAYYKMETLEHHAKTLFIARLLGGALPLDAKHVERLLDISGIYGVKKRPIVN